MSCGVGCICGSDPVLLWLWRRLAATAPNRSLAWEPPFAMGEDLKQEKKKITRWNQQQNTGGRRMNKQGGRQNSGNH